MTAAEVEVDEQEYELERRLRRLLVAALALRDARSAATDATRVLDQALIEERNARLRVDELLLVIRGES